MFRRVQRLIHVMVSIDNDNVQNLPYQAIYLDKIKYHSFMELSRFSVLPCNINNCR